MPLVLPYPPLPSHTIPLVLPLPFEVGTLSLSHLLPFPAPCKQESGGFSSGKFFFVLKSRWLWVKFDAFLGKI